ncbi:MAG TPA: hypothetical protein PLF32_01750 [Bacteroidales bacterium]|nr:hypothetical protein [Bacteroidales bacterium]HOR81363.1 hypothetical protein [Bacteroidales bacterium]HPJ90841.1 hypothetical protein [Bacteroidales bacterium]
MKKILFYIIPIVLLFSTCRITKTEKSISTLDFKVLIENQDDVYYDVFSDSYNFSMWYMHSCYQKINDTLHFIRLSKNYDTLYVYNYSSYETKKIMLDSIPSFPIHSIYYHNHDSIFVFYNRRHIYNKTDNKFDFILVNRKGNVINTYSINDIPNIHQGFYYRTIEPSGVDHINENRIINGNLILLFSIYSPGVENPEFIDFNPKLLCFYNLSDKTFKMLNVRFPIDEVGKRYNKSCTPSSFQFSYEKDQNIIINFPFSTRFYRYDFSLDSLLLINCKYDYTFENVDSAVWIKGRNYLATQFREPKWDAQNRCYFRSIFILPSKTCEYNFVLQVMDSNFNHIAYVLNTNNYNTPAYNNNNKLVANNKFDKRSYTIQLDDKVRRIKWKEFEKNHLTKKAIGEPISLAKYLEELQIPDNSLVVTINLNYPCGHCLERLFTKMKENRADYEKINVYYIVYDNNSNGFAETLKKRYELSDSKFIKIDKELLERVRLNNKPITDER